MIDSGKTLQELYDAAKSARGATVKLTFDPAEDTTREERRAVGELAWRSIQTAGEYLTLRQRLAQLREDVRQHPDSDLANEVVSAIDNILEGGIDDSNDSGRS